MASATEEEQAAMARVGELASQYSRSVDELRARFYALIEELPQGQKMFENALSALEDELKA